MYFDPSVVTSKALREHTEKKKKKKEGKKQLAKAGKKKLKNHVRKEKRNKKIKISRKRCQIETNSKDDQLTEDELRYCESDGDRLEAFLDLDEYQNFNKGDFRIIKYHSNYFLGKIRELKEDNVKNCYISTM